MPFKDKNETLKGFLDQSAENMFGNKVSTSLEEEKCVICSKPADKFRDEVSKKEYTISGMCQKCQDDLFGE